MVLAALASTIGMGCAPLPPAESFRAPLGDVHPGARVVVVGDVQRTSLLEFWRESNDRERVIVMRGIVDARPDLLAFTGDLVFDGGSARKWAYFDALTRDVRAAGVPVVAAFGNHEYWSGRRAAEEHLFPRVPLMANGHWGTITFGPLRLVFLDSNESELTPAEWAAERAFFEVTLESYDRAPEVRGVVVLMHHPPYTNSMVTSDEENVQRAFVPAFMRAKKTLALLTGHVHSYERFVREGKTFVVSGGGGGPRAALAVGSARRHPDDLAPGPAVRPFHFTVYTLTDRGLEAEVRGVEKDGEAIVTIDRFTLAWPTD